VYKKNLIAYFLSFFEKKTQMSIYENIQPDYPVQDTDEMEKITGKNFPNLHELELIHGKKLPQYLESVIQEKKEGDARYQNKLLPYVYSGLGFGIAHYLQSYSTTSSSWCKFNYNLIHDLHPAIIPSVGVGIMIGYHKPKFTFKLPESASSDIKNEEFINNEEITSKQSFLKINPLVVASIGILLGAYWYHTSSCNICKSKNVTIHYDYY